MTAFADFYDGDRAVRRRVSLRIDGEVLLLELPEGPPIRWMLSDLRRLPDRSAEGHIVVAPMQGPARLVADGDVGHHLTNLVPRRGMPPPPRPMLRPALLTLIGGGAYLAALFFGVLPLLAGGLARVIDPDAEVAMGEIHYEQTRAMFGFGAPLEQCDSPEGTAALRRMTDRVAGDLDLPYDLKVVVLDDGAQGVLNAYAVAGGHIAFFDTMIQAAEHPDEIAAVLAHEIGHVVNRDPVRGQLQQMSGLAVLSLLLGDISGGGLLSGTASGLLSAGYSRDAEAAADRFAVQQLTEAGLPPSALGRMFGRLRDRYGDTEGLLSHFSSHPELAARIEAAAVAGDPVIGAPSLTPKDWAALRAICD